MAADQSSGRIGGGKPEVGRLSWLGTQCTVKLEPAKYSVAKPTTKSNRVILNLTVTRASPRAVWPLAVPPGYNRVCDGTLQNVLAG